MPDSNIFQVLHLSEESASKFGVYFLKWANDIFNCEAKADWETCQQTLDQCTFLQKCTKHTPLPRETYGHICSSESEQRKLYKEFLLLVVTKNYIDDVNQSVDAFITLKVEDPIEDSTIPSLKENKAASQLKPSYTVPKDATPAAEDATISKETAPATNATRVQGKSTERTVLKTKRQVDKEERRKKLSKLAKSTALNVKKIITDGDQDELEFYNMIFNETLEEDHKIQR